MKTVLRLMRGGGVRALGLLVVVGSCGATFPLWWPIFSGWVDQVVDSRRASHTVEADAAHEDADDHNHGQGHGHGSGKMIELSAQAIKNLGLTAEYLKPVRLTNYYRTITIPAIVASKPGRTALQVSSPMIGIVTHVHAVSGEAVLPGSLLFEIRLTYEDLVDTQTELLKNLADLEVEQREVQRLEEVTRSGAVASKLLLERQYAQQKLESAIAAQRAALKLHGLSDEQIEMIVKERRLLRDLSIMAPGVDEHTHDAHEEPQLRLSERTIRPVEYVEDADTPADPLDATPLVIEQLPVKKGQGVMAGEMLCTLSDYSSLYLEGKAFEQDAPAITEVAARGWPIEALIPTANGEQRVQSLRLAYVANAVDQDSRTLSFFVDLPNTIVRDETNEAGQRYVTWQYRIGQRMQLRVPVEAWEKQIVLPTDAAVKEGAEWYVFRYHSGHFDQVAVHVKYRDQQHVVIDNDGSLRPGAVVAWRSAHQLQMALQNQQGAGVDPHAGHNH